MYACDKAGAVDVVALGQENVFAHFELKHPIIGNLGAVATGGQDVLCWCILAQQN